MSGLDKWTIPEVYIPSSKSTIVPIPKMKNDNIIRPESNPPPTTAAIQIHNMHDTFDDDLQRALALSLQEHNGNAMEQEFDVNRFDGLPVHTPYSATMYDQEHVFPDTQVAVGLSLLTSMMGVQQVSHVQTFRPTQNVQLTQTFRPTQNVQLTQTFRPAQSSQPAQTFRPAQSFQPVLSENTKLILQQNAEYEASLAADRAKDALNAKNNSVTATQTFANIPSPDYTEVDDLPEMDFDDDVTDDFDDDVQQAFDDEDPIEAPNLGAPLTVKLRLPDGSHSMMTIFEHEDMDQVIYRIRTLVPNLQPTQRIVLREPPMSNILWNTRDTVSQCGITDFMVIMVCII